MRKGSDKAIMFVKLKEKLFHEDRQEYEADMEGTVRNIPVIRRDNGIQSVGKEYAEFRQSLDNSSVDDTHTVWNWFCGKLAYFKIRELDQQYFKELSIYAIRQFTNQYMANFDSFLKITETVSFITSACEQLLKEHRTEAALIAARPCMAYLKERTHLYSNGQLCFSSMEEAVLYAAEKGDSGENRADDNYAGFFLCFADILLKRVTQYEELKDDAKKEVEYCLDHAERLSPCNALLWELRARAYRESDPTKYLESIGKALLYSIQGCANDVLGEAYSNLAAYYCKQNYALAAALCVLSTKFGGDPTSVELLLSGCQYEPYPDAELAVHQAGIQVGYSGLARMAVEKANEYRIIAGMEEKTDKSRKVILSASDSNYQYEVRDPMTIVGRSSAMSEYLKMKPTVSRVHARLVKEDDQLFVSDMDAMNGTYVNGIRIGTHRQELHEGDELRLGSSSERGARFTMKTTK